MEGCVKKVKKLFVSRLRKAMEIRDMKQADLVERTGLSKSAISQYYSGIYEPKQKALYKIAKALNVNEATLKRVYKKKGEIILVAENPNYAPMVYKGEELNEIRILGKAIAFQSNVI